MVPITPIRLVPIQRYRHVSRYVGIARVKIYDDSGSFVANISLIVDGTGQSALDLSTFNDGFYEIAVEFDNMIYVGTFEL